MIIQEWHDRPCVMCAKAEGCMYNKQVAGMYDNEPDFVKKGCLEHSCREVSGKSHS